MNHVIFMWQENRSFDSYFGKLNDYLTANHYPQAGTVDGIPALGFTNSGIGSYHSGSVCMENLSSDWAEDHREANLNDPLGIVPGNASTMPMDGFVNTAAGIAAEYSFVDSVGRRAMSYYTDHELNYYYFLAANFGVGDKFYSPAPTNSPINHVYGFGATSQGIVHTPGGAESCPNEAVQVVPKPQTSLPNAGKPIFQVLSEQNISWKIYITDLLPTCDPHNKTFPLTCAIQSTYLQFFSYINNNTAVLSHLAPADCTTAAAVYTCPAGVTDYFSDVKNGTLPAVAFIENGGFTGRDEHPSGKDLSLNPPVQSYIDIQVGAIYVSSLIDALLTSPSWTDSVFVLAYDEAGGPYDHVTPMAVPNPDGIKPILCAISPNIAGWAANTVYALGNQIQFSGNLFQVTAAGTSGAVIPAFPATLGATVTDNTITWTNEGPVPPGDPKDLNVGGDFNLTGFRVPNLVISPFARKNYVSHTPMDYTAVLKFIETRWGLPNLTARDAAMPDMQEFFDFANKPWATPPTPPAQVHNTPCNFSVE